MNLPTLKKYISVAVSGLILAALYYHIGINELLTTIYNCDKIYIFAAFFMFIPTTFCSALRFSALVPKSIISIGLSTRLFLIAQTLNLILPSKMGDVFKVGFIKDSSAPEFSLLSFSIVEKLFDLLALSLWCCLGFIFFTEQIGTISNFKGIIIVGCLGLVALIFSTRFTRVLFSGVDRIFPGMLKQRVASFFENWYEMQRYLLPKSRLLFSTLFLSILSWLFHLLQIWFFMKALSFKVPFMVNIALTPIAIYIGLLPISIAGIGTRDAAFVYLYKYYADASACAILGALCTLRYIVPGIAGLPFTLTSMHSFKISK